MQKMQTNIFSFEILVTHVKQIIYLESIFQENVHFVLKSGPLLII